MNSISLTTAADTGHPTGRTLGHTWRDAREHALTAVVIVPVVDYSTPSLSIQCQIRRSRVIVPNHWEKPGMTERSVISAFSEEHVERLTGITRRQLRYWDSTGFFQPSLGYEDRRQRHSRIYSFRDVACLQVLSALRNEANVSLQHLREVKDELSHMGEDLWAKTTLYVHNRRVVIINPETRQPEEVVSKQAILQIPLAMVSRRLEDAAVALMERDRSTIGQVQRRRGVASSRFVVAGTRIPVRAIQAFAKEGYSIDEIRREYPSLTDEDVRAALRHGEAA